MTRLEIGLIICGILFVCGFGFCLHDMNKKREEKVRQETEAVLTTALNSLLVNKAGVDIEKAENRVMPGNVADQAKAVFEILEKEGILPSSSKRYFNITR